MICQGCKAEFKQERKQGPKQKFCTQACGRLYRSKYYRADREAHNAKQRERRRKRNAIGEGAEQRGYDGADPILFAQAFGDRRSNPVENFSRAMILQAVSDLRGKNLIGPAEQRRRQAYSARARAWLRGEQDADLPRPAQATVCFHHAGIDQGAALEALKIN